MMRGVEAHSWAWLPLLFSCQSLGSLTGSLYHSQIQKAAAASQDQWQGGSIQSFHFPPEQNTGALPGSQHRKLAGQEAAKENLLTSGQNGYYQAKCALLSCAS